MSAAGIDALIGSCVTRRPQPPRDGWIDAAVELVCDVRSDPRRAQRDLAALDSMDELRAMCVTLAAMVPDDKPLTRLLSWLRPRAARARVDHLGTVRIGRSKTWTMEELREAHARYARCLKTAKELGVAASVDELTAEGEREYSRRRRAAARARAEQPAA